MSNRWTDLEHKFLAVNQDRLSLAELSDFLGRTERAIAEKSRAMTDEELAVEDESLFILSRAKRSDPRSLKPKKGTTRTGPSKVYKKGSAYSNTKSGYRSDLGINVRSGWEANTLRVLRAFDIGFEFEPKIFTFPIKRGNKAYIPDIYLTGTKEWIEVKGYLDKNSMVKLKRFKLYYPEEFSRMTMIIGKYNKKAYEFCEKLEVPIVLSYQDLGKQFSGVIKTWEGN